MTNQSTMDKLIEMRLTTMADAFRNQLNDPKCKEIPFEDRFGMLVDIEYSSRMIITVRQSRLSGVARATCPDQRSHCLCLLISYLAWAGSRPYTSLIERSLLGSMLSISILYES